MSESVGVIGAGYLGTTHAACLAELGFDVLVAETDAARVTALRAGRLPFFEPGLADLLQRHTASGQLRFTASVQELADHADVHFICVGTPQRRNGLAADTTQVRTAVQSLVPRLSRTTFLIGKSTVPVGTAAELSELSRALAPPGVLVEVAWNPEFMREGHAIVDTLAPDRLVFGVASTEAEKVLRHVYASVLARDVPVVVTDLTTSELVKVAANAFLATKISFANAMAELCEATGGDVLTLTEALGHDARIGHRFLTPGLGFGGGCLPKDIRALMARAGELGVGEALTFLRQVDSINMRQRRKIVEMAIEECQGDVLGRRIAVLGASFKPETDDVRDSPALSVAAQLHLHGALVSVYDPRSTTNAAKLYPALHYADSVASAVTGAHLVLHLTEWEEFSRLDPGELLALVDEPRIIDGRNALDPRRWRAAGWSYRAPGRPHLNGA